MRCIKIYQFQKRFKQKKYSNTGIAILQYRNCHTPIQELPYSNTGIALTKTPNCHQLSDYLAVLSETSYLFPPGRYHPHNTWCEPLKEREEALRNRQMRAVEYWSEHTKRLPHLVVGDKVIFCVHKLFVCV